MTGRQLFDGVAGDYDATRPDYPAQLFDAVESGMGQPLMWSSVCDVGAGTGIASRAIAGRGATVTAVEPGLAALSVLRSRSTSRVLAVAGDGNALPLRDKTFDLVTYAQSFHWTDPERSIAEAFRVLKQGGMLALWWNRHDLSVPWFAAHQQRIQAACGFEGHTDEAWVASLLTEPRWGARVGTVEIPWSRRISIADFGRNISTKSFLFALPDQGAAIIAEEMARLEREHRDGFVVEPFTTYAVLARR